ncbi:MAG: hypothetical protein K1X89_22590, partial [Myxococcaceae bacterium]|nr:hypothetical protein [Myxococcaceae bacterium]
DAAFTGAHPSQREVPPDPDRERLLGRGRLEAFQTSKVRGDLTLRLAADVELQRRHLLSFASGDAQLNATHYEERGERATAMAELAPEHRRWRAYLLTEVLHRDHFYAERGFSLPETQELTQGGFLAGFVGEHVRAGLTWKRYVTRANDRDFSRELNDVDGEGRFPFEPAGMMNATRLEVSANGGGFYVGGDLRLLDWAPDGDSRHALTWLGAPYGTMSVHSSPTSTWVGEHRAGWARVFELGTFELAVDGALALGLAQASGVSVGLPGGAVKADVIARLRPAFEPFLAVGWVPVGLTSQLALALTPGYFQATQALVSGREVQRYGGEYTRVDPALRTASIGAAAIGFRSRFATTWRASFQGIIKIWDGVPRFELDGPPSRFGHFTDGAYFFDDPRTRYILTNTPRELTPFGGTLQAQLSRVNDGDWFFNVSLAASSFFGSPPPGTGPWANDIGIVDWNGANPNAAKNAFASVDGDRAWVARLGGAYRFWRTLWGSVLVAFRDGQPFSLYQSAMENGQLATWQARLRGSPLRVERPLLGWREDFQCVVDVQVGYDVRLDASRTLRLKLIAANLFDLDNETAERGTPGPDGLGRSALTTQLPRSLAFGLELLETPAP